MIEPNSTIRVFTQKPEHHSDMFTAFLGHIGRPMHALLRYKVRLHVPSKATLLPPPTASSTNLT